MVYIYKKKKKDDISKLLLVIFLYFKNYKYGNYINLGCCMLVN